MKAGSTLYAVRDVPVLENRVYATAEDARACGRGDVVLAQDPESGLVRNEAFDARLITYDEGYQNEQALSPAFREHLGVVTELVASRLGGRSMVEIGCGKGFFLELLREAGHDVIGVDPAYEGTNPAVVCAPFSPELGIRRDGVILRHVLEHVEAPWGFLEQIRDANGGGVIYIEVPTFDWILANRAWFDVFYEHVTYFRLSDLTRMFGQVHDAGALFGGQYIYVVADLGTLRPPSPAADVATVPDDFLRSIDATADRLRSRPAGSRAIWGAGAKGVVFALLMQRAGIDLDVAIDINPAKQGRYLPATGLRVCSPGEAMLDLPRGADVSVMNGNYLDEIRAMTDGRFNLWAIDHAET